MSEPKSGRNRDEIGMKSGRNPDDEIEKIETTEIGKQINKKNRNRNRNRNRKRNRKRKSHKKEKKGGKGSSIFKEKGEICSPGI